MSESDSPSSSMQSERHAAVSIEDVSFRYPGGEAPGHGVDSVSLCLGPGQVLGLLGPNGSGKSTLLSLVAGFLTPQSGGVRVLGEPVSARVRRRLGVVFQDASVDPLMSVEETLRLHGRLFGVGGSLLRERTRTLLERMGIADRASDRVETLSGGLRRRVELARALLHEPAVLLLDEPSLGLDPDSRTALWEILDGVRSDGTALLLATNDVAEAQRVCDRVTFLREGSVVATGTPEALTRDLRRDSVRVEWVRAPVDAPDRLASIQGVGAVREASTEDAAVLHVTVDDASAFVPALFAMAGEQGSGSIAGVRVHESTLEDAYFQRVGTPLQAEGGGNPNGRAS